MKNHHIHDKSAFRQVKFKLKVSFNEIWSSSIERFISAMCKLVVMILILLTLLVNYLMIVFYKCLWVLIHPHSCFISLYLLFIRCHSLKVTHSLLNVHQWVKVCHLIVSLRFIVNLNVYQEKFIDFRAVNRK